MAVRLRNRVKGAPLFFSVRNDSALSVFDFTTGKVYLFLENQTNKRRILFQYAPGGGANDGYYQLGIDGKQRVIFHKPAEWTRQLGSAGPPAVVENWPVGEYYVWPWFGDLTGESGKVDAKSAFRFSVTLPETDNPLGPVG